jgi:hypothetical protein
MSILGSLSMASSSPGPGDKPASASRVAPAGSPAAVLPVMAHLPKGTVTAEMAIAGGPLEKVRPLGGVRIAEAPAVAAGKVVQPFQPHVFTPVVPTPIVPVAPLFFQKTATRLAQEAIRQLNAADANDVDRALNAIQSRNVPAARVLDYLERKVKIGEVLGNFAAKWSEDTQKDFAEAFPMEVDQLAVMDCVVSIAILNDPDLEEDIRKENTPETTQSELLENRRIVWQYPPPGTPLDPPYLVLVAVEHEDVARADEVVASILDNLVPHRRYKLPKVAVDKLRKLGR